MVSPVNKIKSYLKKLITLAYRKWCFDVKWDEPMDYTQMSEADLKHLFQYCSDLLRDGILKRVCEFSVAESEGRQLEEKPLYPLKTTEAELERTFRKGVTDVMTKVVWLASKAEKKERDYDKFGVI
jgi:hypothetical protein